MSVVLLRGTLSAGSAVGIVGVLGLVECLGKWWRDK